MLSAIVICRDRSGYTARCLASLTSQSAGLGHDFEIVVVEQGSASLGLASGLPVTYIGLPYGDTINRAWLCNVGARAAKGEWLYQVDCDMILERDAIRKILTWAGGGRSASTRQRVSGTSPRRRR